MITKSIRLHGLDLLALLGEDFVEGGVLTIIDGQDSVTVNLDKADLFVDVGDDGDLEDFDDDDVIPFSQ